ncbi:8186_t:CDS:2, partial [Rhizophagus irregularis]
MTQTRTAISDEIKYEIYNYQIKNPNISHENIAIYFNRLHNINIKRPTISKILKDRERWLSITNNTSSTYRHREVKYPSLEQALSIWDKTRITVLLGCNSNGTEKIKPLVIGNAQKPHCLRGINISNLPVSYYWNKKAWMTQDIFRHWIKILDNKFQVQKRQVLILLDNASSHLEPKKKEANNNELYNSDETSAAESSHTAKNKKGKKRAVSKPKKSQAINYLSDAWLDVSQNTISNCWAKAGIFPSVNHVQREVASDQIDMELDVKFEEIEELLEILPDIGTPFLDDIDHYIKELEELPVEEFLDDKQIIEYVTKDSSEEVISDSEPELEIISIKEAAQ